MPNFFYFHFDGFSTFVTLLERQLILLCFWTQSISIIASKYWPWPWPDYLDIMTIDLTQMFTTFRLLARHTLNFCKLLFNSFNDFFFLHEIYLSYGGIWPMNIQAVVSELWYVEEYDVLALALDGRTKIRRFQLGCSRTQDSIADKHN